MYIYTCWCAGDDGHPYVSWTRCDRYTCIYTYIYIFIYGSTHFWTHTLSDAQVMMDYPMCLGRGVTDILIHLYPYRYIHLYLCRYIRIQLFPYRCDTCTYSPIPICDRYTCTFIPIYTYTWIPVYICIYIVGHTNDYMPLLGIRWRLTALRVLDEVWLTLYPLSLIASNCVRCALAWGMWCSDKRRYTLMLARYARPCITTHCNALPCTATHCNALHRTASHCTALQCSASHCNMLQYTRGALQ